MPVEMPTKTDDSGQNTTLIPVRATFRDVRRARGFTMQQLADKLDCAYMTIQRWDAKERVPGVADLRKLIEILGVQKPEDLGYAIKLVERVELCAE